MIHNGQFWAHYFRSSVISKLQGFRMVVHDKLLPPFNSMADEANAVGEEEYRRLGQMPGDDSVDMADLAEQARDVGIDYYETMTGVRQALLNILAVALHHLLEQQLLFFLRRALLKRDEERDHAKFHVKILRERLLSHGINAEGFSSYSKIDELCLVANTAKHAEGSSSDELFEKRPEMFTDPFIRLAMPERKWSKTPVRTPLTGDDFSVTVEDLDAYFDAAVAFCEELATELEAQVS